MSDTWKLILATLYLYAVITVTKLGFLEYFRLEFMPIDLSPSSNIIFVYLFLKYHYIVAGLYVLPFVIFVGLYYLFSNKWIKLYAQTVFVIFAILGIFWFEYLGTRIAALNQDYLVVAQDCPDSTFKNYFIESISGNMAMMVILGTSTSGYTRTGSFIVRDVTTLPCTIRHEWIGPIK